MFSRRERLSRTDFEAISKDRTAKRSTSQHFSIVKTKLFTKSAAAVIVAKKVEKSSVKRHLLKRRISEVIRTKELPLTSIIVYAREGSSHLTFTELSKELSTLLS